MAELVETMTDWVFGLGDEYGVNPVLFGMLYLLSIPPYLISIGWIVSRYRKKKPLTLPIFSTGFFFIAPALYLVVAGRDVPWGFYLVIGLMVLYGIYGTWQKVNRRVNKEREQNEI